ncbi:hypothetical protein T484DRAFT_1810118 [Baffinella frigidus]|nr:hypothetical protein T484DRAFT_1810118 [Cryptophyta sp. CCMP2293]
MTTSRARLPTAFSARTEKGRFWVREQVAFVESKVNFVGSKILGLSSDMCKSVVFVASGKTLPLCLTVMSIPPAGSYTAVLSILPAGIGDKGLIALPAILGHFSQIVMDSAIAASWKTPPKEEDQRRTLA